MFTSVFPVEIIRTDDFDKVSFNFIWLTDNFLELHSSIECQSHLSFFFRE